MHANSVESKKIQRHDTTPKACKICYGTGVLSAKVEYKKFGKTCVIRLCKKCGKLRGDILEAIKAYCKIELK